MNRAKIIECVPNFSEGRDPSIIQAIAEVIKGCEGVRLLDVDPGVATNRTVVTFVGDQDTVVNAAFEAIKVAYSLIDMRTHKGEHPRFGACDVCPFIPVAHATMEDCVACAHALGKRLENELGLSGYFYESAASSPERKNLAAVRAGEYEGLPVKLENPQWRPDFGPVAFNAKFGAVAIGARDFLIAYNVNLNTTSVRRANAVAFDVREQGRVLREGDALTGKVLREQDGTAKRQPGKCPGVKAIGWYIEEYGVAQISMNITDTNKTSLHEAFEACCDSAHTRGLRVTGSELVGLVPKKVLLDAGRYFLHKQSRSSGLPENELIHIAVKSMGLDELGAFDANKKVIEYLLVGQEDTALVDLSLKRFAEKTAGESPAPGGGSVSAAVGALGASLGTMVANLSAHKRGWDDQWSYFSQWADQGQAIQEKLLFLVDEDTRSFNAIIAAIRMPKGSEDEKKQRFEAIESATRYAMEVPDQILRISHSALDLMEAMVEKGNPNSITDVGVGAFCILSCMEGALYNVRINARDLKDQSHASVLISKGQSLLEEAKIRVDHIRQKMNAIIEV